MRLASGKGLDSVGSIDIRRSEFGSIPGADIWILKFKEVLMPPTKSAAVSSASINRMPSTQPLDSSFWVIKIAPAPFPALRATAALIKRYFVEITDEIMRELLDLGISMFEP